MVTVATTALPLLEDALSQSLRRLGLGHVSSLYNVLARPWGIHFPTSSALAGFHLVCEGRAWIAPERGAGLWLETGDLVLFPFGAGHTILDHPASPSVPYHQMKRPPSAGTHALLCGAYKFGASKLDVSADPVLAMLPEAVHVRVDQVDATPGFAPLLANLREEVQGSRPGRDAVICSLVGAAFIYMVRSWLSSKAAAEPGWIGAPRDPRLSRALAAIHVNPAERWSVEKLAELATMSRASFARRFVQVVGETPLAYVAARRLDLAARLLSDSDQQLGEIAAAVGYESEFALSRAFKRSRNVAPGRFRAMVRAGARATR
jgi:AraC-like DNA-binding protein